MHGDSLVEYLQPLSDYEPKHHYHNCEHQDATEDHQLRRVSKKNETHQHARGEIPLVFKINDGARLAFEEGDEDALRGHVHRCASCNGRLPGPLIFPVARRITPVEVSGCETTHHGEVLVQAHLSNRLQNPTSSQHPHRVTQHDRHNEEPHDQQLTERS